MKKLYRVKDPSKKKIAGICAGIAENNNFDPNIIRIIAVFICVITGIWPLVAAYAAGWYLIPDSIVGDIDEDNIAKKS